MRKNKLILIIAAVIIAAGLGFYAGTKYSPSAPQTISGQTDSGNSRGSGAGRRGGSMAGAGFVSGEILSKDDKGMTIKTQDGGSKIIFFSSETQITKSIAGSLSDIATGERVLVNGKVDQDGSVTADSIQIRPASPTTK